MTTTNDPCIRGCQRPCGCDACRDAEQPEHPPQPRLAQDGGLLCRRCENRLWTWTTSVLDDTARLDPRIQRSTDQAPGKHHKISGSPALVRLDVAALTDPRTVEPASEFQRPESEYYDAHPPIDIPGEICMWAGGLAEDHDLVMEHSTLAGAVNLITTHWHHVVSAGWVVDYYDRMEEIRRLLNRAHRVERPQAIGHCLTIHEVNGHMQTCEQPLYARADVKGVKCYSCCSRYVGLDLIRLKVAEAHDTHTDGKTA